MATTIVRFPSAGGFDLVATLFLPDATSRRAGAAAGLEETGAAAAPLPALVVGHGAGSRRTRHEPFCAIACEFGFAVLALDCRGHGDSAGLADGPLEDDILAAVRFLRAHPAVDGGPVCYRGSSMGGFYGLKAAAAGELAAAALLCPASAQVMLPAFEHSAFVGCDTEAPGAEPGAEQPVAPPVTPSPRAADLPVRWDVPAMAAYFRVQDTLAIAAEVRCPVLLVHAKGDEVVPLGDSLALVEGLAGEATLLALPGGSHTSAQHDPAVHEITVRWLLDQLRMH